MIRILDIGCGSNKYPGAIGIDINPAETGADFHLDVNVDPLPFNDSHFGEVRCNQFLEHVRNIYFLFDEVWRVMEDGALWYITVPYYTSIHQAQDPTHVRAFNEATFDPKNAYFNAVECKCPYMNERTGVPFRCVFKTEKVSFGGLKQPWMGKPQEEIEFARGHFWNVYGDMSVILRADKSAV